MSANPSQQLKSAEPSAPAAAASSAEQRKQPRFVAGAGNGADERLPKTSGEVLPDDRSLLPPPCLKKVAAAAKFSQVRGKHRYAAADDDEDASGNNTLAGDLETLAQIYDPPALG